MTTQRLCFSVLAAATAALTGGCLDDAPAAPTWREHVEPILRANCMHCHDGVGRGGASPTFRLDVVDDLADPITGQFWRGARTMAPFIAERAGRLGEMPPGGPELNDYQRGVLTNWAEATALGDPATNHPPTMTATLSQEGELLVVDYEIHDADGDRVRGWLSVDAAASQPLATGLHAGRGRVSIDMGQLAPGPYTLRARLSDNYSGVDGDGVGGPDGAVIDGLGTFTAIHLNTAPTVSIGQPFQDQLFSSADLTDGNCAGPQCVQLRVTECKDDSGEACEAPDGPEVYTVKVEAVRGAQVVLVASDVEVEANRSQYVPWNPMTLPSGTNWRVRVTVSDGTTSRSVLSSPFMVGGGVTTATFASDIKPLVDKYCDACHKSGGAHATSFFTYDGDVASVRGSAGLIYRRVVELELMPLVSGETLVDVPQPTHGERQLIGEWLLAGGQ